MAQHEGKVWQEVGDLAFTGTAWTHRCTGNRSVTLDKQLDPTCLQCGISLGAAKWIRRYQMQHGKEQVR